MNRSNVRRAPRLAWLFATVAATGMAAWCSIHPRIALADDDAAKPAAPAAEMVDNPAYKSWSSCKVGTSVTYDNQTTAQGMTMKQTIKQTLAEVTPEKCVVDYDVTVEVMGQKQNQNLKRDVSAKVAKGHEYLPPDIKGEIEELGNEKVEVAGKSYDCKVIKFTGASKQPQLGNVTGKRWICPEIPGQIAKMEMTGDGPASLSMSMSVSSIDAK